MHVLPPVCATASLRLITKLGGFFQTPEVHEAGVIAFAQRCAVRNGRVFGRKMPAYLTSTNDHTTPTWHAPGRHPLQMIDPRCPTMQILYHLDVNLDIFGDGDVWVFANASAVLMQVDRLAIEIRLITQAHKDPTAARLWAGRACANVYHRPPTTAHQALRHHVQIQDLFAHMQTHRSDTIDALEALGYRIGTPSAQDLHASCTP